jgi:hypothetical protein
LALAGHQPQSPRPLFAPPKATVFYRFCYQRGTNSGVRTIVVYLPNSVEKFVDLGLWGLVEEVLYEEALRAVPIM